MSELSAYRPERYNFFKKLMMVSVFTSFMIMVSQLATRYYDGSVWRIGIARFAIELTFPIASILYSLFLVGLSRRFSYSMCAKLYIIINVTSIMMATLLFGGHLSPAMALFVWPIVVAGILFRPQDSIIMGAVAMGWFGLLLLLSNLGIYAPYFSLPVQYAAFQFTMFLVLTMFPALALLTKIEMKHLKTLMSDLEFNNAQLQLVAQILDNIHNGLLVTDQKGRVLLINPAFLKMTRRKKGEVLGRELGHLQRQLFDAEIKDVLHKVRSEGVWQKEVSSKTADGETLVLSATVNSMGDQGAVSHYICIFSDVTKIRKAESASNAKSRFLAHMSHEIRTPMNGVIGMTQLAMESNPDPEMGHYLNTIKNSANNLIHIINDILDFSKIEAGQMVLENHPFNIREMAQSCIDMFTYTAREKGVQLLSKVGEMVPEIVVGDATRLKQVIINLIGNGLKFTDVGSVILSIQERSRNMEMVGLSFRVADTGRGIAPDKIDDIFQRFTQEDSTITRKYGGTGLGLAISKRLVEAMGGKLGVSSVKGEGSTFGFRLRLRVADELEAETTHSGRHRVMDFLPQLTLLVVDDNITNRQVTRMILEKKQHVIHEAENGLEALEQLTRADFDAVLLDIQMPLLDGISTTKIIRQIEAGDTSAEQLQPQLKGTLLKKLKGGHLPVIAVTAHAMGRDRQRCIEAGMDDYLSKPLLPEKILASIYKCVYSFGKEGEIQKALRASDSSLEQSSIENLEVSARDRAVVWLMENHGLDMAEIDMLLMESWPVLLKGVIELKEYLESVDMERVARKAHYVKGGVLALGLTHEAEQCKLIELMARGEQSGDIWELVEEVERGIRRLEK